MGGRYLLTGSQLGMLVALSQTNANKCNEELNEIIENQMVWNSEESFDKDFEELKEEKRFKKPSRSSG